MSTVYVVGGGVAGLTAAHELAQRSFDVVVFERQPILGGKARSMPHAGSGTDGRADLPGEHGFRFFPGFYFHLTDTMQRIVVDPLTGKTAAQNLIAATEIGIAQKNQLIHRIPATRPSSLQEWLDALQQLFENPALGVPLKEARVFLRKLLCFLGAGRKRRLGQYEGISWWDFIEAGSKSQAYQDVLARGLSQSLVAMRPDKASTLTVASMLVQITVSILEGAGGPSGKAGDRVLNAPTNDAWINPWVAQLEAMPNVTIHRQHSARRFNFDSGTNRVTGVVVADAGGMEAPWGTPVDHYIAALPVEVVQNDAVLFPPAFKAATGLSAPGPAGVDALLTEWMTGVLFYMNRDVSMLHGHVIYANSPWALTSISQRQFWGAGFPWTQYGDGTVRDILSTIISDWDRGGTETTGKTARQCTRAEILAEIWAQAKAHLAQEPNPLTDGDVVDRFIDPAIQFDAAGNVVGNSEPLLINTTHSRAHRPGAATNVPNFLVASDYVLTETDLACMEAANEASRAAVNAILAQTGSAEPPCAIKPLSEPAVFEAFQQIDDLNYPIDPSEPPVLCQVLDELLPNGKPSFFSDPVKLISIALNVALVLYLLLKD